MAGIGFDWLCFDMQHGAIGPDALVAMLQASASGPPVLVRVPWNDPSTIMRVLDLGAAGVIVPLVNSAEEARRAAGACFYPPDGYRSFGPIRRSRHLQGDHDVLCMLMVETVDAVRNIDAIVSTPGVGAVFIGPADLALSAGLPPSIEGDDPGHLERIARVVDSCARHSVVAGIAAGSAEGVDRWRNAGLKMLSLTSDSRLVALGATQLLAAVRAKGG
jgi:4-hydroxy-2-oxoheptanedioate aldolase